MPKNLLVLASTFPRWQGDTEPRFIYDLCSRLGASFNVTVIAPHASGAMREETMQNIKVYRYRYAPDDWESLAYEGGVTASLKVNKLNYLLLPLFFFAQLLAIRKVVKQQDIDIIHAHWLIPQGMLALLGRYLWGKKIPVLCTSHGGDLFGLEDPASKKIKQMVIRYADGISVVSNSMLANIAELNKAKKCEVIPVVIPMGTDLNKTFIPDPNKKRKPYQLLFVGRLVEKKGLEYLVKCLCSLQKIFPEISLKIAGTGPELETIKSLADATGVTERIIFLERVSHADLASLYQESAMAVFPFVQADDGDMEGLGLVMVEAMGCECPVIAGDVPAVHDVIEHEASGLIINPRQSGELEQAITRILNNQMEAQEMARRGRAHVMDKFSWESVTERYAELLDKIDVF